MSLEDAIVHALNFAPEESIGPVAAKFYYDNHQVSAIMGPVGSAKTSTALMKTFRHALLQKPNDQGVVYYKHAVIRDTYRNLADTTIKSWLNWIPKELGDWKGGGSGEPASHHLTFSLGQYGLKYDLEIIFKAMGDNNAEDVLKGLELSSMYINEADRVSPDVISFGLGRIGRYPSLEKGKCSWRGIWCDMNAPEEDNYMADLFIFNKPESYAFFEQPSGISPDAENLKNLTPGYYQTQKDGMLEDKYNRLVLNKIGFSRDGKPVYNEYNDKIHTAAKPLEPVRGLPLHIGADAGLTPAAAIGQKMPNGQWRILMEIISTDVGVYQFADLLNRTLSEHFPGFAIASATCDPAASAQSSTDKEKKSWLQILRAETGINFQAAQSNSITIRLEAVKGTLTRLIDGEPGFLLSPACKMLRRGFVSKYVIKNDEPAKNEYSHIHDGVQYLVMGGGEYLEVLNRHKRVAAFRQPVIANSDFGVFG